MHTDKNRHLLRYRVYMLEITNRSVYINVWVKCYVSFLPLFSHWLYFQQRTGEMALGYGDVAEESLRRFYPRKAYLGRCEIFTVNTDVLLKSLFKHVVLHIQSHIHSYKSLQLGSSNKYKNRSAMRTCLAY